MGFLSTLKLDRIFLDGSINSRGAVLRNLSELFYLLALRFNAIVCSTFFQVAYQVVPVALAQVYECSGKILTVAFFHLWWKLLPSVVNKCGRQNMWNELLALTSH